MRERLIKLLDSYHKDYGLACSYLTDKECEDIADLLLSNSVILPPCKVGDKVFSIFEYENKHFLDEGEVGSIYKDNGGIWVTVRYDSGLNYHHKVDKFDIQVFLTREEAEKALAERMKDNG